MLPSSRVISLLSILCTLAVATANAADSHAPHWRYSGEGGPDEWGGLAKDFALCGSGKRQSPIDIRAEKPVDLYALRFHYRPVELRLLNNGHTLQVNYESRGSQAAVNIGGTMHALPSNPSYNSMMMVGDAPYPLIQFHFHTPSEHAVAGERYPMEVHLVHKHADGNLAVVGVFFKTGAANAVLQTLLDKQPNAVDETTTISGLEINAADLLPASRKVFHYTGSLTTPPCSENVNWFVMSRPIEASAEQLRQFSVLLGNNARPLQNMHWRSVFVSQ